MKKKAFLKFVFCLLLVSNISPLSSQNTNSEQSFTEYKGTVKDAKSGDVLVFADVSLINSNIATITNNEGEFLIKIPDELKNTSIKVSYLGYKQMLLNIVSISNKNKVNIKLEPQLTELTEISIHSIKDAKSLVKRTLSKKGENYLNNETLMTAFYRETIKKRRKNASLSEAVVEIYKEPYRSHKNDKINLVKARKNVNYSKLDTVALKLQGGPFSAVYSDLMKYQEFVFTENDLDDYNFDFESIVKINNNDVYIINFKQKDNITTPLYYGKLYIDVQTLALTSATYSLNVSNRELASRMYIRKKPRRAKVYPTKASYRVDYKVKNGLWYYSYSNIALTFKVNWENKLFNSVYSLNSEMAVTDWRSGFDSKAKKDMKLLRPTTILTEEASGFSDPNFWGKYNIIEPEKSIESAIKKINKQLKRS